MNIKKSMIILSMLTVMLFVAGEFGFGWRGRGQGRQLYDTAKEKTYENVSVIKVIKPDRRPFRLVLEVKLNDGEKKRLHMGPVWYYEGKEISFKEGDVLTVIGMQDPYFDNQIAPREIKRGDETIKLRNEDGRPVWIGDRGKGRRHGKGYGYGKGRRHRRGGGGGYGWR